MGRVLQTVKTNTQFATNGPQLLFMIPMDEVINVFCSVDGHTFEDISGRLYGEQLCSITYIPCNTYFKLVCDNDVNINILKS